MAEEDREPIEDPDHEIIPADPGRRRTATLLGCMLVLVVLVFLVWFAANNLQTFQQGWFGR